MKRKNLFCKNKIPKKGKVRSIRRSLFCLYFVTLFIAVIGISLLFYFYVENSMREKASEALQQTAATLALAIDTEMEQMNEVSKRIASSGKIKNYYYNSNVEDYNNAAFRNELFQALFETYPNMKYHINIFGDKNVLIQYGQNFDITMNRDQEKNYGRELYEECLALEGKKQITGIRYNYGGKPVISLSRALNKSFYQEYDAVIEVQKTYDSFEKMLKSVMESPSIQVCIYDNDGEIVYPLKLEEESLFDKYRETSSQGTYWLKKDRKILSFSKADFTGWTVVVVESEQVLLDSLMDARNLISGMVILIMTLMTVIMYVVLHRMTIPINHIREAIADLNLDSLSSEINLECDKPNINELDLLYDTYDEMVNRLRRTLDDMVALRSHEIQAQLLALQAQTNPHFLYNTLDSIIWMAEGKKNREVVLMTSALARLLRQSISAENELVPLIQEIDYVKNYLAIQKMRYKDKLEYEIEVEPSVKFVQIIKLVLQPLVENAIYHGLKYKEGMGHLSIRAYMKETQVCIEIADDGVGMTQEVLDHIFDQHKIDSSRNGVGVYNVQQRLQLYYGEDYGVRFVSSPNEGTTAIVSIPASGGEENEA